MRGPTRAVHLARNSDGGSPSGRSAGDENGTVESVGSGAGALRGLSEEHLRRCREVSDAFFRAEADRVSRTCRDLAKRFHGGGRMLVAAPEAGGSDARHVSVEFVHPVLVGKRALPTISLEGDAAARVGSLGRPRDVAMGIATDGDEPVVVEMMRTARETGLLTLGLTGGGGGALAAEALDHLFVIPSEDPLVVQEVQETLYHILWELVHVFFEHEAML